MESILHYLLGVDIEALRSGTDWTVKLNSRPEAWVALLILIAAYVFAGLIYRKDVHAASLPMRILLGFIRGSLVVIALLVLFEPVIVVEHAERRRGVVAVLVDESRSMTIRDRLRDDEAGKRRMDRMKRALGPGFTMKFPGGEERPAERLFREDLEKLSRIDIVNRVISDPDRALLKAIDEKGRVRLYKFSSRIWPTRDEPGELVPGETVPEGNQTALGRSVRMGINDLKGLSICGVVVFSDGRSTTGEPVESAAAYARAKGIPIFTVGVGDPAEPRDVEMSGVEAPEVASVRDYVNVDAFVSSTAALTGKEVEVAIALEGKVLASEKLTLSGGSKQKVSLRWKPEAPGEGTYTVSVTRLPGEIVEENNEAHVRMRLIEDKTRVLYLEGVPRWEYRYLKNALIRDTAVEAACLLWRDEKGFYREGSLPCVAFPETIQEILGYDVIIIGEIPPTVLTEEQKALIKAFVSDHSGGLMMIAGGRYAPAAWAGTVVADMLPVVFEGGAAASARVAEDAALGPGFRLELTDAGKAHDVCRLNPAGGQANLELWQTLPPMFWCFPVRRAKAAATVLVAHPIERSDDGQRMPVVATQFYGSGRTMFVGTDGLWRWRWGVGDRFFYRFYSQAIQYLAHGKLFGAQKRFSVSFDPPQVALGERVRMRARVLDRDFKPAALDSVDVLIEADRLESRKVVLKAIPGSVGLYEGEYLPPQPAVYTAAAASPGEQPSQVGTFEAVLPRMEFADPRMDEASLKALALGGAEGGRYLEIDEVDALPSLVQSRDESLYTETEIPFWDTWRALALFTALITLEWVLRKWCRML